MGREDDGCQEWDARGEFWEANNNQVVEHNCLQEDNFTGKHWAIRETADAVLRWNINFIFIWGFSLPHMAHA
jgi:hypothetical protein